MDQQSKAYYIKEQESDESKENISEKKMNIEMIYFLPSRDVNSIARNMIESVMMAKCLPGIFLPSPHRKLAMMAKCISSSYLPSMNQKLMIDFTSYTHNLQRRELSTYNKNNNGN